LHRLKQKPLIGIFLNPLGVQARHLEYQNDHLRVTAKHSRSLHISSLTTAPLVTKGLGGGRLQISVDDGTKVALRGAKYADAISFRDSITADWVAYNTSRFEAERLAIDAILRTIAELSQPVRYPSACTLSPILEQARAINTEILSKLTEEAIGEQRFKQIQSINGFVHNAGTMRDRAIKEFELQQLPKWQVFFDTFESNPLTPEQRTAIIADEDATLVLAGAGSGKTSVITAKAGYLLKSGIRKPEEILLLAFARDAAKEMSERIEEKCGEPLEARTFHALAYDIIGAVEGSKPALTAHATDDKAFLALIKDILRALVQTATGVSKAIMGWFSYARLDDKSE